MIKRTYEELYAWLGLSVGDKVNMVCLTNYIPSSDGKASFILTADGLKFADSDNPGNAWIPALIRGEYALVPWEPKEGEHYYYVYADEAVVLYDIWRGTVRDLALLALGFIFPTEAEAEAHITEIHEKYRKIREGKRFE